MVAFIIMSRQVDATNHSLGLCFWSLSPAVPARLGSLTFYNTHRLTRGTSRHKFKVTVLQTVWKEWNQWKGRKSMHQLWLHDIHKLVQFLKQSRASIRGVQWSTPETIAVAVLVEQFQFPVALSLSAQSLTLWAVPAFSVSSLSINVNEKECRTA